MSKGQNVPNGVRYFTYEQHSTKGKAHPAAVNAGQSNNKFVSGSHPAHSKASGTSSSVPGGVKQKSGKENHVDVKHLNAAKSGPTSRSGASAHPAGVRKFKDNVV